MGKFLFWPGMARCYNCLMIKAIITDIDGVIIGEKIGFNSPNPNQEVLSALKTVRQKGIPIALCTAKPYYAILDIIKGANLNNPHITDAGAVIYDPIDKIIVDKEVIDKSIAKTILLICLQNNIYVEFYTLDDYFIQEDKESDITKKHFLVLQRNPKKLQNIVAESEHFEITKIMPISLNSEDKSHVAEILNPFNDQLSISWGVHPVILPLQIGIITEPESSKKEGSISVAKSLNISFDEILGIGDSTSDWSYMELCGYAATLENGTNELKELITQKGAGKYFIGKSVDQNGILDVLNYFKL